MSELPNALTQRTQPFAPSPLPFLLLIVSSFLLPHGTSPRPPSFLHLDEMGCRS